MSSLPCLHIDSRWGMTSIWEDERPSCQVFLVFSQRAGGNLGTGRVAGPPSHCRITTSEPQSLIYEVSLLRGVNVWPWTTPVIIISLPVRYVLAR